MVVEILELMPLNVLGRIWIVRTADKLFTKAHKSF